MKIVGQAALSKTMQLMKTALAAKTEKSGASVTLTTGGWTGTGAPYAQTVSVSGVTASNSVIVSPDAASIKAYGEAGVYCSAQASGSLTFACSDVPSSALTVNVLILT